MKIYCLDTGDGSRALLTTVIRLPKESDKHYEKRCKEAKDQCHRFIKTRFRKEFLTLQEVEGEG